jgi:hypothetical protein
MEIEKIMMGVLESKSRLSCASAELLKSYLYYSSIHFLSARTRYSVSWLL